MATGAWVQLDHPLSPIQGRHRLISAELDLSAASLACTVEAPVGAAPAIETMKLSTAFDPVIQPGVTVEVAGSEIIFTARDEQGRVLAGAMAKDRLTGLGGSRRFLTVGGSGDGRSCPMGGGWPAQEWCWIRPGDTPETLWRNTLAPMGLRLFGLVLASLDAGTRPQEPQDAALATWEPAFSPRPLAAEA